MIIASLVCLNIGTAKTVQSICDKWKLTSFIYQNTVALKVSFKLPGRSGKEIIKLFSCSTQLT